MKISQKKFERLEHLSTDKKIIAALAIDQRGAMRRMVPDLEGEERTTFIKNFKSAVAKELTKHSSSILLDPVYGTEAIDHVDQNAGLLLAYEKTGYRDDNRQPDFVEDLSVRRIRDMGADAVKVLLYYDVDDTSENNEAKKAAMERVGAECQALDMPFFLEIITYDENIKDSKSREFAKVKPRKVIKAMEEFCKEEYLVDVLKMEVPVNMKYVEGFSDEEAVYTREEAMKHFKDQSDVATVPYIFLSAGVSAEMFLDTLRFAKEADAQFHGVLCGRATWAGGVDEYLKSDEDGLRWLQSTGSDNIEALNQVVNETATPWTNKLEK